MRERGYGHTCEPRYRIAARRTPDSSHTSRDTVVSNDSPASANPAKHEYLLPPHAALAPRSTRSGSSADDTSTMTAGSVRGKCSRPQWGQCRDHPAWRRIVRVPQAGQTLTLPELVSYLRDIEEVAAHTPEKILKETIDPAVGLQAFQARKLAFEGG